jgi:hypothetical protein
MTSSVKQVWVIPSDPNDLAPLPALVDGDSRFSYYNRREGQFGAGVLSLDVAYATFQCCREAMIAARTKALEEARQHTRLLATTIEHLRFIPATPFPSDVTREVPEAQHQEAQGQEEASAEEVKPAKTELKRPSRRS